MAYMTIDGRKVEYTDEKNVLSVIRKTGISLPTLCYHSERVSTFAPAASALWRMTGEGPLHPCSEEQDGMVVYQYRKNQKIQKAYCGASSGSHCRTVPPV